MDLDVLFPSLSNTQRLFGDSVKMLRAPTEDEELADLEARINSES